jgi:hypothetical protein
MMWMAIPHVAIIGSLLLACHSPHTLKAIVKMPLQPLTFSTAPVSDVIGDATEDQIDVRKKICSIPWLRLFPPVFGPTYMTASMWNRGQAKRKWISKFVEEYPAIAESIENEVLKHNFKSLAFSAGFPASFLACVPCFLGGMIR